MCAHLWNWLVPKIARHIAKVIAARKKQTLPDVQVAHQAALPLRTTRVWHRRSTLKNSWRSGPRLPKGLRQVWVWMTSTHMRVTLIAMLLSASCKQQSQPARQSGSGGFADIAVTEK